MVDNVVADAGAGGATFATDDIGGVHYPLNKLGFGALDSFTIVTTSAGLPIQQQSGASFTVANSGTFAVQVDAALPAGTNNIGDVDVLSVPSPLSTTGGGTEATALRVTVANNSTGTLTVDNAGTFAVQVDSALPAGTNNIGDVDVLTVPAPLSTTGGGTEATALRVTVANNSTGLLPVDLGTNNDVQGAVAAGASASGNPFIMAAEARNTEPIGEANGQVVRLMSDLFGKLVIEPYAVANLSLDAQTTHTSTTTNQQLFAAPAASNRNHLVDISISNTSATDTEVIIKDDTTENYRFPCPANGGVVHRFGKPLRFGANNQVTVATADSVATVRVSATGYRTL